jgi:hypothetical protein
VALVRNSVKMVWLAHNQTPQQDTARALVARLVALARMLPRAEVWRLSVMLARTLPTVGKHVQSEQPADNLPQMQVDLAAPVCSAGQVMKPFASVAPARMVLMAEVPAQLEPRTTRLQSGLLTLVVEPSASAVPARRE